MMDYVEWRSFWELTNFKSFTVVSFFGFHFHLELFKNQGQRQCREFPKLFGVLCGPFGVVIVKDDFSQPD